MGTASDTQRRVPARLAAAGTMWALALASVPGCGPLPTVEPPEPAEIETTLFLIGDAGEPDPREVGAPLDSMTAQAAVAPGQRIIPRR